MAQRGNIVDFNEARASSSRHAQSRRTQRSRSSSRDASATRATRNASAARTTRTTSSARSARSASSRATGLQDLDLEFKTPDFVSAWQKNPSRTTSSRTSSPVGQRASYTSARDVRIAHGERISRAQDNRRDETPRKTPSWLEEAYADLDATKSAASDMLSSGFSGLASQSGKYATSTSSASSRRSRRNARGYTRENARVNARSRTTSFEESQPQEDEATEQANQSQDILAKLKDFRHQIVKDKAGRQFDRQFAGTDKPSTEAGPRAALYRGEMGESQRRGMRMQRDASPYDERPSFASARFGGEDSAPETDLEHAPRIKRSHPFLKASVAVVAIIICACAFMFPTVQSYYQTIREQARVEAEYQAVQSRNEALSTSISDLSSDDGVAAYAHDQYGWVKAGEQSAVVQGIDVTPKDGLDNVNASVQSGSVKAPETWYSPVLDKIFGVE